MVVSHGHLSTRHTRDEFVYNPPKEPLDRPPHFRDISGIIRFSCKKCTVSVVLSLHHLHYLHESAEYFTRHLHELHESVHRRIITNNETYKSHADKRRRERIFNEGKWIMVRIRPERLPLGPAKNLSADS
ncbi:hypothetical protein KSP40_PGU020286 [Platanthera guangdongensis]|uniref:C2H2-type domain-containing protein n=1 Tax=Platanthera guangdongensis TaxID=2320717 RepID=A0ABR2MDP3_9ASPA